MKRSASTGALGLLQTRCSPDPEANLKKTLRAAERAAGAGAQIICTQELFRSQYFCQSQDHKYFKLAEPIPGPGTDALQKLAKKHNAVVIASLFEKRAAGVYHNTAAIIDADGSLLGIYRKMHIPDDPFFVEQGVVRDVHFAIDAEERTVGVNDRGGVVVNAGGAFLEQRCDDDRVVFLRELLERIGAGAGDGFGQFEIFVVLALAEILGAKQFLRADDLRAGAGRALGGAQSFFQIRLGVRRATGLQQPEGDSGRGTLHLRLTLGRDARGAFQNNGAAA